MSTKPTHYRNRIQEELVRRSDKNSRYSLRAFAQALGMDAGTLSRILTGKKVPSQKLGRKIIEALGLPPEEVPQFWNSIADAQRQRGLKRMSPAFKAASATAAPAHEAPEAKELSLDLFRVISDWYHYAILELTYTPKFKAESQWIAAALGITPIEAKLALERLFSLGLLTHKNGRVIKSLERITTADKQVTTSALKRHQKQILEKAVHSLENDPLEERSMTSMTMSIDPAKLPEARRMIDEFTDRLCAFLEAGERKQVFEVGIALYPLQTRKSRNEPETRKES